MRYHIFGDATYLTGAFVNVKDRELPTDPAAARGLPESDNRLPLRVVWLFDFQKSLLRKESRDWSYVTDRRFFRPIVRTDVFNGQELKGLIPHAENTGGGHVPQALDAEFEIGSETKVPWFFNLADLPVLYAHGLFRFQPTRMSTCDSSSLVMPTPFADLSQACRCWLISYAGAWTRRMFDGMDS